MKHGVKLLTIAAVAGFMTGCATTQAPQPVETQPVTIKSTTHAVGQYTSDAVITSKVKAKFMKHPNLRSGISVSTNHGIVTLTGKVANDKIRQAAINKAMKTKGVKAVDAKNLMTAAMTLQKPTANTAVKSTAKKSMHHKHKKAAAKKATSANSTTGSSTTTDSSSNTTSSTTSTGNNSQSNQ